VPDFAVIFVAFARILGGSNDSSDSSDETPIF
jgi:hypothetical protein